MSSKVIGLAFALTGGLALGTDNVAAATIAEVFAKHSAGSTVTVDHSSWDKLLKTYVKPDRSGLNRVNYGAFKARDHRKLKAYIRKLEATNVASLGKAEQFAFWVNLYNAKTVDVILDYYPVTSIRKITIKAGLFGILKSSVGAGGPWKAKIMKIGGTELSLDDVEHGILRPIFRDPRVHYAVNCASVGCPNLRRTAFTGGNIEASLEAGAVAYINSPRGIWSSGGRIQASSIYKWFQVDFGGSEQGVLKHVRKYAKGKIKAKLDRARVIDGYAYDWSLNDHK